MEMNYAYSYYDTSRGWDQTNPGWHEVRLSKKSEKQHLEIVKWMYDNIDSPEKHCRWIYHISVDFDSYFKFRYERDFIWFRLHW